MNVVPIAIASSPIAPGTGETPVSRPDARARSDVATGTRHALLGWFLVSAIHCFILTAGFVWPTPSYSAYYSRQADAFLKGQTHLILQPRPELLSLPDPYDPVANRPFRK